MKKHFDFIIAALAFVLLMPVSCKHENLNSEKPVIQITVGDELSVAPEGGNYSVEYILSNEMVGGIVGAECEAEWIAGLNVGNVGIVEFSVAENGTDDSRSAWLVLSYKYGVSEVVKDSVRILQNPLGFEVDYEYEAKVFSGKYNGNGLSDNNAYNYDTWLADVAVDKYIEQSGTYYRFDIFGPAPEDEKKPVPPIGKYVLGVSGETDEMTFTPDYSTGVIIDENGNETMRATFTSGSLEIKQGSNGYVIEALLVDSKGKNHHVTYCGDIEYSYEGGQDEQGYNDLENDIDIKATLAASDLYTELSDNMLIYIQFTDMELDANGYVTPPGTFLNLDLYLPLDNDGKLLPGEYIVSASPETDTGNAFELCYGEMYELAGEMFPIGSYAIYYKENGTAYYGFVKEGKMTVSENGDGYDILCDFITDKGTSVKVSYSGALNVPGGETTISTLTGDYTLDLSNAVGSGTYYGDYYYNHGGDWVFSLLPEDGVTGDGLLVELVSSSLDFESGIPTGVYFASQGTFPSPGEYLPGYSDINGIGGTMYIGGFSEDGKSVSKLAPAIFGKLEITNNGNNSYTVAFTFADDLFNTWDGEWTGEISFEDKSNDDVWFVKRGLAPLVEKKIEIQKNGGIANAVR